MEMPISHLRLYLTELCVLLTLTLAVGSGVSHAQSTTSKGVKGRPSSARITAWDHEVSAAKDLLVEQFGGVNPRSKIIILDSADWSHSSRGLLNFTVFVCDPDSAPTEEQQKDILTRYKIHCSLLRIYANFLMGGSQLGPVPNWITIGRPDLDKRWNDLSAILLAHPEWSKIEIEDTMRRAGVKYGADSHDEIVGHVYETMKRLKPFLGKLAFDSVDYFPPILTDKSDPGAPAWVAKVHPLGQDKTKSWARYVISFNAFDGALEGETTFNELGSSESIKPH
jgi:hypothetical protein